MDDIYPGWDGLAASVPMLVNDVLAPMTAGEPAAFRRWDWARDEPAEWQAVPEAPVLVVEGVGCGSRRAAPYLSLLIWVDAPTDLRRHRGLARDGETYKPHWDRWARQEEELFAAEGTAARADAIIKGSTTAQIS
jgi:hypothetical protein